MAKIMIIDRRKGERRTAGLLGGILFATSGNRDKRCYERCDRRKAIEPPYGVKAEPTTEGAVGPVTAWVYCRAIEKSVHWDANFVPCASCERPHERLMHTDKHPSRRASDRTSSATSVPEKGTNAAAPAPQGAPQHYHRRYSDSIYGPPTRYEMWPHRRSTDIAPGDKEHG